MRSLLLSLAACGAPVSKTPIHTTPAPGSLPKPEPALVIGTGDVVLRGTIARQQSATDDNRPFVVEAGGYIELELRAYAGEDREAPLVLRRSAELPPGRFRFPRAYELRGELSRDQRLLVEAKLAASNASDGFELVTEQRFEIRDEQTLDLIVVGLESCTSPAAGGYCR